jgi:hypothetical protein
MWVRSQSVRAQVGLVVAVARLLGRLRREHRVGELQQGGGSAGWAKREHVFVKVPGPADGLAEGSPSDGPRDEKPCPYGESASRNLQRILQR